MDCWIRSSAGPYVGPSTCIFKHHVSDPRFMLPILPAFSSQSTWDISWWVATLRWKSLIASLPPASRISVWNLETVLGYVRFVFSARFNHPIVSSGHFLPCEASNSIARLPEPWDQPDGIVSVSSWTAFRVVWGDSILSRQSPRVLKEACVRLGTSFRSFTMPLRHCPTRATMPTTWATQPMTFIDI